MSILGGKYSQPCVYESGLWVTLMCPHPYPTEMELVVVDDKYLQYKDNGAFELNNDYIANKCETCGHECHCNDINCKDCINDVCGVCKCEDSKNESK
mgnify:FL=1